MSSIFTLPLSLSPAAEPQRTAAAWLVTSGDALEVLTIISAWKIDLTKVRLVPLPQSRTDLRTCAMMVIPPSGAKGRFTQALPYGWQGSKLLLPIHAALRPALTTVEVDALITAPLAIWHPGMGLVECDDPHELRASALLAPATIAAEDWNAAQLGDPPLPPLRSIGLRMTQVEADPFGGAGDEIGTQSLKDIPLSPDGKPASSALSKAARKAADGLLMGGLAVGAGMAKLGEFLFSPLSAPHQLGRPAPPGFIRRWLAKQSAGFFEKLDRLRNKEIHHLLDWLAKDPEMALKFALPLTALGDMQRGIAPPGARLGSRDTNFSLRGLGGGGAADTWSLSWQHQEALRSKYRELANHALAQGRYRRAAYIFAQLLGDITSAAEALRQGRFYAEAAVLYRDRLHNKQRAAECLAEGGLMMEAAELYEELKDWIQAGELYERLDLQDHVRRCYDIAVKEALDRGDLLTAARLTEERLKDPTQALHHLRSAWPAHKQAIACLTAEFDFHERHGRPEAARHRVQELRPGFPKLTHALPLTALLTQLSRTYPDGEVRRLSQNAAITQGSLLLQKGEPSSRRQVLTTLAQLHPEDRLFQRDAARFLQPSTSTRATAVPAKPERDAHGLLKHRVVSSESGVLELMEPKHTKHIVRALAASYGPGGLAILGEGESNLQERQAGMRSIRLTCFSLTTDQQFSAVPWAVPLSLIEDKNHQFQIGWVSPSMLWFRHPLGEPMPRSVVGLTPESMGRQLLAGSLGTLPADTIALDDVDGMEVKALRMEGVISCHGKDGTMQWTNNIPFSGDVLRLHLRGFAMRRDAMVLALGDFLHVISHRYGKLRSHCVGSSIISFTANSHYARPQVAAGLECGVVLLRLDEEEPVLLDESLIAPLVIFNAHGTLMAFTEDEVVAFRLQGSEPARLHRFPAKEKPVAVTAGPERNQVIAVFRDGTWEIVDFRERT